MNNVTYVIVLHAIQIYNQPRVFLGGSLLLCDEEDLVVAKELLEINMMLLEVVCVASKVGNSKLKARYSHRPGLPSIRRF